MRQATRLIAVSLAIVGLVVVGLVVAAVYLSPAPRPVAATATPTNSPALTRAATSVPTLTSPPAATTAVGASGRITGKLGYPSTFIPELTVYAMRQDDPSRFFSVDTPLYSEAPQGSATYTIEGVAPGTYVVVAYPKTSPKGTTKGGGWTVFARCGNAAPCGSDHTLIPVVVTSGATASGADATDWYLPQDQHFPPKPS